MQYTQLSRRSAGGKTVLDWEKQYLTFIPTVDTMFNWTQRAASGHLEYSINGGQTWVTIASGGSTPTITAGNKVIWRGDLKPAYSITDIPNTAGIGTFSASGNYHAYGNTMSLLFYDNYYGSQLDDVSFKVVFGALFYNDIHLLTAPLLPSTTISQYAYDSMFRGCTSLTTAPALPATTLADYCYRFMFRDCKSLTTAPELPATTLTSYCYYSMFRDCTSLTTAPELPATTLEQYCYNSMFNGCTSLSYIKCLATGISESDRTYHWLRGVSSTGTFVKAAGQKAWTTGVSGIPSGWTVINDNS